MNDDTLKVIGSIAMMSVIVYSALYYADTPEKAAPSFVMGVLIYLMAFVSPKLDEIERLIKEGQDGQDE